MAQQACNLNPKQHLHSIYNLPKKERFNEGLEDVRSHAKLSTVNSKNLQALDRKNSQGPKSVFSSHVGGSKAASRVKSAVGSRKSILTVSTHTATIEAHKKRIIDAVNHLNEEELTKVSEMLKVAEQIEEEQKEKQEQDPDAQQEGEREGSVERMPIEQDEGEVTAPVSEV